jgi:formate-dependent nitrite reductase membrane component NrfD
VGATSTAAVFLGFRDGALGKVGNASGLAAGVLGLALATYTGVLVANSAVPLWQESRRMLPALFGSSAMSSVGCLFEMIEDDPEKRRVTTVFGTVGQLAEIVTAVVMERQASVIPRVGEPLRRGLSGFMWRTAAALTVTSAVIGLLPNRTRMKGIAAGVLGTVGSLLMRLTIEHAGVVSARDARASFHQQRGGHGAAEVTEGSAAIRK